MIIRSILDTDLYKFTCQNAILKLYPHATGTYKFNNRNKDVKFNKEFLIQLNLEIKNLSILNLNFTEESFLRGRCSYFDESYIQYIKNYTFNPEEVECNLDQNMNLNITIKGLWHRIVLWEVPLMSIISELYFKYVDTKWKSNDINTIQKNQAVSKSLKLTTLNGSFTDFGTRRRRSYEIHDIVLSTFADLHKKGNLSNFSGSSNMHFCQKYNLNPIGTTGHEWSMGISALESLRRANKFALEKWSNVYQGRLGIALTDTFGTPSFLKDFNEYYAKLYDGVRQDSGDPLAFTNNIIDHYKKLKIDPTTKIIIFSDGLDVNRSIEISNHCKGRIKCAFGIGTHLTNHVEGSKPLNMVIKLHEINEVPVVKISDSIGKIIGDADAVRVAKWTFFGESI